VNFCNRQPTKGIAKHPEELNTHTEHTQIGCDCKLISFFFVKIGDFIVDELIATQLLYMLLLCYINRLIIFCIEIQS